jgi:hypothetical protein
MFRCKSKNVERKVVASFFFLKRRFSVRFSPVWWVRIGDEYWNWNFRHVGLAYQPPANNSTFFSEQTNHQQPASITFLSE